jgi:hypothetical protein
LYPKPQGEPKFYLAENGITCKCENVISGNKGVINGVEYEAVNTSLVTNMSYLFSGATSNQPIRNWDVSNVINMEGMFSVDFESLGGFYSESPIYFNQPIGDWNVSNVTNMDLYVQRIILSSTKTCLHWCVSQNSQRFQKFYFYRKVGLCQNQFGELVRIKILLFR